MATFIMPILSLIRPQSEKTVHTMIVVPISIILHIFVASHISYYKRKYQKQDDTVYSIQIQEPINEGDNNFSNSNLKQMPLKLNTRDYNEILYEVSAMIIFSITLIITLLLIICITTTASNMSNGMLYLSHIVDHLLLLTLNVVLPCTLYIFNNNLRLFIKGLFIR